MEPMLPVIGKKCFQHTGSAATLSLCRISLREVCFISLSNILQLVTNAFAITDDTFKTLGTGLYIGISAQDHSCTPDVFVYFEGSTAVMRSPEVGKKIVGKDRSTRTVVRVDSAWSIPVMIGTHIPQYAMELNAKAKMELNNIAVIGTSPAEIFEHWLRVYGKFAEVLSPYNTFLVSIGQKLLLAAESVGQMNLLDKYDDIGLAAYRRYLPRGHPELTQRLRLAFLRKMHHSSPQEHRPLLLEAYDSAVLSHGDDHPITLELSSYISG
ncbi:unnamed protein product [Strongylus vulgaris]|uniref:Uncharacterized protein n=1 Tax=Strongylus vulgaris TaxID=40348 RepID=A0A3P7KVH2_STRVU|nr:unnamed protein product [Strongylus vulgaris]